MSSADGVADVSGTPPPPVTEPRAALEELLKKKCKGRLETLSTKASSETAKYFEYFTYEIRGAKVHLVCQCGALKGISNALVSMRSHLGSRACNIAGANAKVRWVKFHFENFKLWLRFSCTMKLVSLLLKVCRRRSMRRWQKPLRPPLECRLKTPWSSLSCRRRPGGPRSARSHSECRWCLQPSLRRPPGCSASG